MERNLNFFRDKSYITAIDATTPYVIDFYVTIMQVVPQYLLPRGPFMRLAHAAGEASFLGRGRAFYEAFHPALHRAAWAIILHQVK